MALDAMETLALAVELRLQVEHISRIAKAELERSRQLLEQQRRLRKQVNTERFELQQRMGRGRSTS